MKQEGFSTFFLNVVKIPWLCRTLCGDGSQKGFKPYLGQLGLGIEG